MRSRAIAFIPIVGLIAACSSTEPEPQEGLFGDSFSRMKMSVDATASPQAMAHQRFVILPAEGTSQNTDNVFQENALLLTLALEKKGFQRAASLDTADTAIFVEYSTSKPTQNKRTSGAYVAQIAAFTLTTTINATDLVEYRRSGVRSSLWHIHITAELPIGDIRMVFPYMVVAGVDFLGKPTEHTERFSMAMDDHRVEKLTSLAFPK